MCTFLNFGTNGGRLPNLSTLIVESLFEVSESRRRASPTGFCYVGIISYSNRTVGRDRYPKVKKCLAATIARLPALSQVRTIHCMYHVCPTGMEIWYHTQSLES